MDAEQLDKLQIEMYHTYLPRLEEAGYIQWDRDQHIVVKGPEFERIKPVLEMFEENADELPVAWP